MGRSELRKTGEWSDATIKRAALLAAILPLFFYLQARSRAAGDRAESAKAPLSAFNLKDRAARHWAWHPIRLPRVPTVKNRAWVRSPVDAFVLSRLEASGMSPAPPADRRTLIRRVTFDLIGLPPTPDEVDAFVRDRSAHAFERVVDRLLASPHYGERWARHWLDLVRFAETYGHEGDYEKPGAFQYRDYVIRAINADVPYDRFVMEHVAGDLIGSPRRNPELGFNESILGTGFWWLGEGTHSPVDLLQDESDRIDNQIDVFGKAFLGLGLGCARCHNHKFDAISTKDYYALAGFLRSSRYQLTAMDCPERLKAELAALELLSVRRDAVLLHAAAGALLSRAPTPVPSGATVFEDFSHETYVGWSVTGQAFGAGPHSRVLHAAPDEHGACRVRVCDSCAADSGFLSDRLQGVLRSQTFTIKNSTILYHVAGRDAEVRLIVGGLQLIQDPIYGGLRIPVNAGDTLHWVAQDVSKWIGHRAYIELADPGPGHFIVDRILFSDRGAPEEPPARMSGQAERIVMDAASESELQSIDKRRAEIEATLIEPPMAPAMADGTGEDDRVHIRGSYKTLGDSVPRRFLEAFSGTTGAAPTAGSGRLALAHSMVSSARTPLLPRVIVNRLWQHHFGEGIVRTPDDFGVMGVRPTHPELLDWLASTFVQPLAGGEASTDRDRESAIPRHPETSAGPWGCGWSLKRLHRLLVLSSVYRMASRGDAEAERIDPTNRLLHKMPLRRLEAEAIRDAVLAVSGRLDQRLYGPSIPPYLSAYVEGRGKPAVSGPMDGDGRRSIYISVRRNFLPQIFQAFDFPVPFTCIGRRATSNVPAQALAMMNNPFLWQQSRIWARRNLADLNSTAEKRIVRMYLEAFARPPDPGEISEAREFLTSQPDGLNSEQAWTDLCHVLFNVKAFQFVN